MIGILDSGLGGLSVLNEIHKLLPQQQLCYFGDSAWCPYGTKSYAEIQQRVSKITDYLIHQGAELIVIACNSATIACVEYLRATYPIPIVGMEPGVKPAAKLTQTGKIGVFATEASLAGAKFHGLISTHAQQIQVITQPCPEFVTLVESGLLSGESVNNAIHRYAQPLQNANVDVLVLGCTHYPFLKEAIQALYPCFRIIDTGHAVAKQVKRKLQELKEPPPPLPHTFYTSAQPAPPSHLLAKLCPMFSNAQFTHLSL